MDSEILARLLASDFICQAYVPPKELREVRAILRQRAGLKKQIVATKNHIHAALARHAICIPVSDLFGKRGRELILNLDCLPQTEKAVLASNLKMLDALESLVKSIQKHLDLYVMAMKESGALLSIPGIDSLAALTIISEIGDIRRFPSPKKLSSYAGLAPSVHQSGKARYTGHITNAGRSMLRWIMVQAAQHAVRKPGALRDFYLRLKHKKGHKVAIVASSRKLLTVIWSMLTKGTGYEEARDDLRERKLLRILRQAAPYPVPGDLGHKIASCLEKERGLTENGVPVA